MKNQIKTIRARISKLNDTIDRKIINGSPYSKEAKEHKNLVYYLKDLK